MHRLYEWLKTILQEKINIFIKGFFGGSIVSGIFLFDSPIIHTTSITFIIIEYLFKVLVIAVTGVVSGCASMLGNDLAVWIKTTYKKIKSRKRKKNPRKH